MATDGIKRSGRATQGVIVMRLREGETVSSLAPVIGADEEEGLEGAEVPMVDVPEELVAPEPLDADGA